MKKTEVALSAVGVIIALIALIPAFGQWLLPRDLDQMGSPPQPASTSAAETPMPVANSLPLPPGLDQVMPGMRLSEARLLAPGGELGRGYYSVALDEDLFSLVTYHSYSSDPDPVIDLETFRLRDSRSRRQFLAILRHRLAAFPQQANAPGGRMLWPDVNGFEISLDDSALFISRNGKRPS